MLGVIRSELLKMRHTFSIKLVVLAPLVTVLLGYILSGKSVQYSSYNWWSTMILPLVVSLWSANTIIREKKTGMQNVVCLPVHYKTLWVGKVFAVVILLAITQLFMWIITTGFGFFTTMYISPLSSLMGCILLFITYLWQIPFVMFLSTRLGYLGSVLLSLVGNIIFFSIGVEKSWFFINPYAISARITCPFFKMLPNGIPLQSNSPLLETGYVFPAIIASLIFALIILWCSSRFFKHGGNCHD